MAKVSNLKARRVLGGVLVAVALTTAAAAQDTNLQALRTAAEAGDTGAQMAIGLALLWGPEADPPQARLFLQQAARSGDMDATRVLGEHLVGGWVMQRDVPAGLPLLQAAVAAGDAEAKVVLGSFYLYGTGLDRDSARALDLFEDAARAGNGLGLQRYGEALMWSRDDPAVAEDYLRRSGEMGVGSAWTTLAEGAMYNYLGKGSRAKFDGYAERGLTAGENRIVVLEAQRRMWGISMRASGPEAVALLEQAADAGNTEAVRFLIRLVRDGNKYNVRRQPARALGYFETYAGLLSAADRARYSIAFDAAAARSPTAYAEVAEAFERRGDLKSAAFGKDLFAANPNLAIYILQVDMKRRGVYGGPLDGMAAKSTLSALLGECPTLDDPTQCNDTVMHPDVIGALLAR